MIGEKFGPYEILSEIGSGGMGSVYKARDARLGRIVAIKKVKEQHSERFKQEARSIAALNHPNICQIHDIGDDYLVLEYVEGKPLSSPLPEQEAVKLAIQIAQALRVKTVLEGSVRKYGKRKRRDLKTKITLMAKCQGMRLLCTDHYSVSLWGRWS
jgi:serine/threonine protein kinase